MAAKLSVPSASEPLLDAGGRLSRAWHTFFASLTDKLNEVDADQTDRVAAFVADLTASPTVEQIATAFNSLLEGLQDSGLQETS